MRKRTKRILAAIVAAIYMFSTTAVYAGFTATPEPVEVERTVEIVIEPPKIVRERPIKKPIVEKPTSESIVVQIPEEPVVAYNPNLTKEEIDLVALVAMAEAGCESEYGIRLVIDTVLNRVDHPKFPNTVYEVVYQKNQFTSMWNGLADRCYVRDDIVELVKEELVLRTDSNVIFFRTRRYSSYGVPMFKVGAHYFSSY